MTDITIKFNFDTSFRHIMIVPSITTCKDLLHRLHLRCPWRYAVVGSFPIFSLKDKTMMNKIVVVDDSSENMIVPKKSYVTIHKLNIQPFFFHKTFYDLTARIQAENQDQQYIKHILVWINYRQHDEEPIILYLMNKENGMWNSFEKTSFSFDEVEDAILNQNVFNILSLALERFYELKEEFGRKDLKDLKDLK